MSLEEGLRFLTVTGRETIAQAVEASRSRGTPFDIEVPPTSAAGRGRWVRITGEAAIRDVGRSVWSERSRMSRGTLPPNWLWLQAASRYRSPLNRSATPLSRPTWRAR